MAECACGAEITWAITQKGSRTPLDAEPRQDGNIVIVAGVARVIDHQSLLDTHASPRYVSHFATCPDAAKYRKRDRR